MFQDGCLRETPNACVYDTTYLVKRGARVFNIGEDILNEIRDITQETVIIVVFGAGINNCTLKLRHWGGIEIVPLQNTSVLSEISQLRTKLNAIHPNVLFDVATIPMIHLAHSNDYAHEIGALKLSRCPQIIQVY